MRCRVSATDRIVTGRLVRGDLGESGEGATYRAICRLSQLSLQVRVGRC